MAQYQTADGRWIVGNVQGESDYHGFLGWRDCVIQLTASGATPDSVNYLNAFRDYAFSHKALNESIMPPSVNVWISNNGVTSAVQADDLSVDGNTFIIGGIKWTGSAWDYSNAGQGGGGGGSGGGGALVVTVTDQEVTVAGTTTTIKVCDKTATEIYEAAKKGPVWFYYPVTQTNHDITVYYHPWFYLEVALLTNKYEFHTSSSDDMSFTFKASNGSDYPATEPVV